MRHSLIALRVLLSVVVLGFTAVTAAYAQSAGITVIEVELKRGMTVSEVCQTFSGVSMYRLPGTIRECITETGTRNQIRNFRDIDEGSVLKFAVVTPANPAPVVEPATVTPGVNEVALQKEVVALRQQVTTLTRQVTTLKQVRTPDTTWKDNLILGLAIAALVGIVLAALSQVAHARDKRELRKLRQEPAPVPRPRKSRAEHPALEEIPVTIKQEYVRDPRSHEERTFLLRIVEIRRYKGAPLPVVELPWKIRRREYDAGFYNRRAIERLLYEHSDKLEEATGIPVTFPDGKSKHFDELFENSLPTAQEILERHNAAAHV